MNDMYNDDAYEAIESAIKSASGGICPQVDLDPKMFDPLTQGSFNSWYPLFDSAISAERHRISEDQDEIDQITYSATCGWLHGYSCAQKKASLAISNKDMEISNKNAEISAKTTEISNKNAEIKRLNQELVNTQNDLTQKTVEADNLEICLSDKTDELKALESTDKGQLFQKLKFYKRWCKRLLALSALAVAVAIIAIVIIIIN